MQEQVAQIRTEYNIFTAFFDGIFGGILSMYETITNGIAIGGISVGSFISTCAIILIASFIVKVIL